MLPKLIREAGKRLVSIAGLIFVLVPAIPASAATSHLVCQAGLGKTIFSTGTSYDVKILPGNPLAAFDSELFLAVQGQPAIHFGNSKRDVGKVVHLGRVPKQTELEFKILVNQTRNVFFSGVGSRNPNGFAQAIVQCVDGDTAIIGFEDLINAGDGDFADLRFQVKARTCDLATEPASTPSGVDEEIAFPSCGVRSVGPISAGWGSFGVRPFLESDAGEKLELECVAGAIPAFELFYTKPSGQRRVVGMCPFRAGCNRGFFEHSGDKDVNGKPDCFILTRWESRDYGSNDNPNPFTGASEPPGTEVLDHAVMTYDVVNDNLLKEDRQFAYRVPRDTAGGPPVPCILNSTAEGAHLRTVILPDPPLGPSTDAFFASVFQRLQQLGPDGQDMTQNPAPIGDLNGDGIVDVQDTAIFNSALGSCIRDSAYSPLADVDGDGCVTFADQQIISNLSCPLPAISAVLADPNTLWPPDHKMVEVTVDYLVTDSCDPAPTCTLTVTNNETGSADSQTVDVHHVTLRAERNGNGTGRTYTISIGCTDSQGNTAAASTTVTVPHDQGH